MHNVKDVCLYFFMKVAGPTQAERDDALWRMPPQTHRASYTIPTDQQLINVSTHMRNANDVYKLANRLGFFESELQVLNQRRALLNLFPHFPDSITYRENNFTTAILGHSRYLT